MARIKTCGIYCIKNIINEKQYIGRSVNIQFRIWEHKNDLKNNKDSCSYLQNAWNKYGYECFEFSILEKCTPEKLNGEEIRYIKLLETHNRNKGYNLTSGGGGLQNYHHSNKTKEKISISHKGKKHTKESKKLISKNHADISGIKHYLYGKKMKKETLDKLSIARSGKRNYGWGKKTKNATSKYLGIYFDGYSKRWVSRVRVNKKLVYIGKYTDEKLAATAYDDYIIENNLENTLNFSEGC